MLLAFDVDGTICSKEMPETYRGPVSESMLHTLEEKHHIVFVSPSPYIPEIYRHEIFAPYGSNEYRWANVDAAMKQKGFEKHQTAYIDDLEANRKQLERFGVMTFTPEEFIKIMDHIRPETIAETGRRMEART